MVAATRLSGLQKDVLALYRSILREAVRKDRRFDLQPSQTPSSPSSSPPPLQPSEPTDSTHRTLCQLLTASHDPRTPNSFPSSTAYARDKFRREAALVRRSDFKTIEYKIRKGKKQLQLLKMPGVNLVGGV
mmetsp:Transcript_25097/g.52841  ORF Transcript_25097/g.52841 Transcript_25097/m.52841 type:complete len:131 (-) Transcript_25097:772-1164(-)